MAAIRNFVLVRFLRTTVSLTLSSTTRKPAGLYLRRFGRRTNSPPQLGQTFFIPAAHFSKQCIHRNRSPPPHLPPVLCGIFRTPASFPKPYNSLTYVNVHQVRAAELRHTDECCYRAYFGLGLGACLRRCCVADRKSTRLNSSH